MKELLALTYYNLNTTDANDKINYTYDDDDTEFTKNIYDSSLDSYSDNYNEESILATTTRPQIKIKSNPNKFGDSTPWNQQPQKLDTSNKNSFGDCHL